MHAAKDWCMAQKSHGLFHISMGIPNDWWFEFERDALIFSLKWSEMSDRRYIIDIETVPVNDMKFEVVIKSAVR